MSVVDTACKRSRGRPQARPDASTRHLIAEAARSVFMANGFAGASIDAVAKAAGVSKKTLYRLVATKADLFKVSIIDRIDSFMLAVDHEGPGELDVEAGLVRLLHAFGNLTMSAETIAIQKLVFAESDRFPELAATFQAEAIATTHAVITDYLRHHRDRGDLALDDPHLAAGMLRGMMIMEPQRGAMMGQRAAPTPEEIAERARVCARLFLRGCIRENGNAKPRVSPKSSSRAAI